MEIIGTICLAAAIVLGVIVFTIVIHAIKNHKH